jgi:hypothetical protein
VIPSRDVNVANDVAFCRTGNLSHRLSGLTFGAPLDEEVDVGRPPKGAWFHRTGHRVIIGATHRSIGHAVGLLFMSLFWNGIVCVFVTMAAASNLRHFGLTLPQELPIPRNSVLPVGMTIFLWVFLTPFIAVGLLLLGTFASCLAGASGSRFRQFGRAD